MSRRRNRNRSSAVVKSSMFQKGALSALFMIAMGTTLLLAGNNMRNATVEHHRVVNQTVRVRGTKGTNAGAGAVIGAATGGTTAAIVGGIGIVVAGTGIGLPAGAALICTAGLLGAGGGAVIGAATGSSSTSRIIATVVTTNVPAHDAWIWLSIIAVAICLIVYGCVKLKRAVIIK